ncbi:MAG: DUF3810 family protein, partial [Lachnospiraceae bacterium]
MKNTWKAIGGIGAVALGLNVLACSRTFCDFYTEHIYPFLADGLGWLMDRIPVPVGEIFMYLGIVLLLFWLFQGITYFFWRKKEKLRIWGKRYAKGMLAIMSGMFLIYTICWVIPFRSTPLEVKTEHRQAYTAKELLLVRAYVVEQINEIAEKVPREKNGQIQYSMQTEKLCKEALKQVAKTYPRLGGYYPRIKEAFCSDFLEWMHIGGYTYPYTMELTYNRYTTRMYFPTLYMHEMAHHKGYYKERDATFLSFLAGSESKDLRLQYSAYLELYGYLEDACEPQMRDEKTASAQPQLSERVLQDQIDIAKEYREKYAEHVNRTLEKAVSQTAEDVSEAGWESQ